tara:strand:- start:8527 stop:9771 length:1245 start_codon:yes stop_codon:yes gene_type:complete
MQKQPKHILTKATMASVLILLVSLISGITFAMDVPQVDNYDLLEDEKPRILKKAQKYLKQVPRTVTADTSERSLGNKHDWFSEADYWWPDPKNPGGKYIRRDGESNPNNFVAHRHAMVALSEVVATLTSAYLINGKQEYVDHIIRHISSWFVDPETRMNPSLQYSQGIKGRYLGRASGIIDTIHLVEVARSIEILAEHDKIPPKTLTAIKDWFRTYLRWLNEHPNGQKERTYLSNHGVCWSMQAAAFARLIGDEEQLTWIRRQFKDVFLGYMMNKEGGFKKELTRTKPYGYSLFVIDAMAGVATLASTPKDNLWTHTLKDGRSMELGLDFIAPYIEDKSTWTLPPDVLYWDEWPVRQPSLLHAGFILQRPKLIELYKPLEADPTTFEVLRNLPLRHPLLWVDLIQPLIPKTKIN